MLAAPLSALDLPLEAPAWQDANGKVWLSYNDPEYVARRHGLSSEQVKTLVPAGALLERAAH